MIKKVISGGILDQEIGFVLLSFHLQTAIKNKFSAMDNFLARNTKLGDLLGKAEIISRGVEAV